MNKVDPQIMPSLPKARIRGRRWNFPYIWVVPILAALVAGYLVYHRVREFGATITIRFRNAEGLKPGQTALQYRGVVIGEVSAVELSQDQQFGVVKVKLRRSAASVAREGSNFWIVRPEVEMGSITGLGTLIAGPHIEVLPGNGETRTKFLGVERSPVTLEPHGLRIILLSGHAGSLRAGAPVYYRGIDVGAVQQSQLSSNSAVVETSIVIKQRYATLVRSGSKFWNVTGMDVKFGIFRGAEINVESLKSLMIGGIAFATPADPKLLDPVNDGAEFRLYDGAQPEWLQWSPLIVLSPAAAPESETESPAVVKPVLRLGTETSAP